MSFEISPGITVVLEMPAGKVECPRRSDRPLRHIYQLQGCQGLDGDLQPVLPFPPVLAADFKLLLHVLLFFLKRV